MRVIAEGIETVPQLRELQRKECAFGQGYLFSKPLPAARVARFLRDWERKRQRIIPPTWQGGMLALTGT
jgi:EAL domain-containing protein (putative c-di-GMP-specific phosphodiesterase class I)